MSVVAAPLERSVDGLMEIARVASEVQHGFVRAAQFHANGIAKALEISSERNAVLHAERAELAQSCFELGAAAKTTAAQLAAAAEESNAAQAGKLNVLSDAMTRFTSQHASLDLQNEALSAALASLEIERAAKAAVVDRAREAVGQALGDDAATRAELHRARLENVSLNRDLEITRANLEWAELQLAGNREEVTALLATIQRMGDRCATADTLLADHEKLRATIRALEESLPLDAITAAQAKARAANPLPRHDVAGRLLLADDSVAPPDPALRDVAPELYTMQVLDYRGVSLSELAASWFDAKDVVARLVAQKDALNEELATVHRNAHRVFLALTNEEKRRVFAEKQLMDMSLQRVVSDEGRAEMTRLHQALARSRDEHAAATVLLQQTRSDLQRARDDLHRATQDLATIRGDASPEGFANTVARLRSNYNADVERLTAKLAEFSGELGAAKAALATAQTYNADVNRAVQATRVANEGLLAERDNLLARIAAVEREKRAREADVAALSEQLMSAKSRAAATTLSELQLQPAARRQLDAHAASVEALRATVSKIESTLQRVATAADKATAALASATQPYDEAAKANDHASYVELREAVLTAHRLLAAQGLATEEIRAALVDRGLEEAHELDELARLLRTVTDERDALLVRAQRAEQLVERHCIEVTEAATAQSMERFRRSGEVDVEQLREQLAAAEARAVALQTALDDARNRSVALHTSNLKLEASAAERDARIALLEKRMATWRDAHERRNAEAVKLRAAVVAEASARAPGDAADGEPNAMQVASGVASSPLSASDDTPIDAALETLTSLLCDVAEKLDAVRAEATAPPHRGAHDEQSEAPSADAIGDGDQAAAPASLRVTRLSQVNDIIVQLFTQVNLLKTLQREEAPEQPADVEGSNGGGGGGSGGNDQQSGSSSSGGGERRRSGSPSRAPNVNDANDANGASVGADVEIDVVHEVAPAADEAELAVLRAAVDQLQGELESRDALLQESQSHAAEVEREAAARAAVAEEELERVRQELSKKSEALTKAFDLVKQLRSQQAAAAATAATAATSTTPTGPQQPQQHQPTQQQPQQPGMGFGGQPQRVMSIPQQHQQQHHQQHQHQAPQGYFSMPLEEQMFGNFGVLPQLQPGLISPHGMAGVPLFGPPQGLPTGGFVAGPPSQVAQPPQQPPPQQQQPQQPPPPSGFRQMPPPS